MIGEHGKLDLRPGITNPRLWYPERPDDPEWQRIRQIVLARDHHICVGCGHQAQRGMNIHHLSDSADHSPENLATVCAVCHAILHIGHSLTNRWIEIWRCEISQAEIVQTTRACVGLGLSLGEIKDGLPKAKGPHLPASIEYANDLIEKMSDSPRAYLDEPLCAIFVGLDDWQIEAGNG
jgi:hypothetical protein